MGREAVPPWGLDLGSDGEECGPQGGRDDVNSGGENKGRAYTNTHNVAVQMKSAHAHTHEHLHAETGLP